MANANEKLCPAQGSLRFIFAVKNTMDKKLKNHKIILNIGLVSPDYKPCNLPG